MKKYVKKLKLSKDTILNLATGDAERVAAGGNPTTTRVITECFSDCTCPNTE